MSASSSSLCPGYKQVEEFGPDEEYEEEEEISYVTLDLGSVEPTLVPSSSTYRLIGLDTPTPFLQLSGTILKGYHDSLLGTELLFTDDKNVHDWNKRPIVHVANTEQRITFKEVRLQPKSKSQEKATENDTEVGGASSVQRTASFQSGSEKIDRLTGKTVPPMRMAKGDDKKSKEAKSKRKGKGKEKEVVVDQDAEQPVEPDDAMDVTEG